MKLTKLMYVFLLILTVFCMASCAGNEETKETSGTKKVSDTSMIKGEFYTSYNLYYEQSDKLWSINYRKGSLLPAGTKVSSIQMGKARRNVQTLSFQVVDRNQTFTISFQPQFHPGLSLEKFRDRLFSSQTFEQLTKGLKKEEIENIKIGRIGPGMSKKAALVSYGYPPEHATPSTNANTWYYWLNRFHKMTLNFDDKGLTTGELPTM